MEAMSNPLAFEISQVSFLEAEAILTTVRFDPQPGQGVLAVSVMRDNLCVEKYLYSFAQAEQVAKRLEVAGFSVAAQA